MTRIPTLDPAAAGGASGLAGPLADALADTGFCIVTGHGIDLALIREVRRRVRELFALPPQTLERDRVQRSNYRGYVPLGFFTPNDGGGSDMYAAWKLHWEAPPELAARSPLYGPNRWPPVPGLRDAGLRYWTALDGLAAELLRAAALGLGLPADRFTRWFDAPLTNMTLLRYPKTGKERWGIHPHKDFDVLTLLAHDPVGGLQVLARDGEWLDAACPEDGFLVNAGDMLELWSGGRIRSAPHRVLNRSGRERVSFPWFAVPEPEVTIEPLLPRTVRECCRCCGPRFSAALCRGLIEATVPPAVGRRTTGAAWPARTRMPPTTKPWTKCRTPTRSPRWSGGRWPPKKRRTSSACSTASAASRPTASSTA